MGLTVVSFIIVMSLLVFVHEFGHFIVAKRNRIAVEEFAFGFPPRLIRLGERDGTVYSINAIPFGGYVRLRGEDDPSLPGSFAAAPKLARSLTLLAGPAMNFLLAIVLFAALTALSGMPDGTRPGAVVESVVPGSPAEQAGLRVGDRIVSAGGTQVATPEELQAHTQKAVGQPVEYEVVRTQAEGPQTLRLTMVPRTNPPPNQGALGIGITTALRPATVWEAAAQGTSMTAKVIWMTFQVPANLIRSGRPISDAGFMGPVGIAVTTGEVVRESIGLSSIQPVLWFMGLLSAAIGITNLLPIPGLDGGRLLFVLFELLRGRRVEPSQEGMAHLIGFGLLLVLIGMLTVREVTSLVQGTFPTIGIH